MTEFSSLFLLFKSAVVNKFEIRNTKSEIPSEGRESSQSGTNSKFQRLNSKFQFAIHNPKFAITNPFFLPAVLFLSTLFLLLSTSLSFAQVNWGPDMRLTDYPNATAYHPKIAVSGDTLHVIWYEHWADTITNYEVMYKRSTDRGETWSQDTILSSILPGASAVPNIAVSGSKVHVVWTEEAGDSVVYMRSTNGGRTWEAPITMTQAGGNPIVGVNGDSVFVEWGPFYRLSYDGGATWSTQYQIPRPSRIGDKKVQMLGSYIQLAPYGYPTDTSVILEVFHQYSSDCGQTWSTPVMISEQDIWAGQWPSIAADSDSNVYVAWYDGKNTPYPWTGSIFIRRGSNNGTNWDTIQNITTLYRAKHPDIVAQDDNVHVAWIDQRDYPGSPFDSFEIYYRYSSNKGNTWGPETRLTNNPYDSQNPKLAVNSGGIYLVWRDNRDLDSLSHNYEVWFKRGDIEVGIKTEKDILSSPPIFQILPSISRDKVRCYYDLLTSQAWTVDIFDILGRKVWQYTGSGKRVEVIWGCEDKRGKEVRSGVYFIRLQAGEKSYQQKVIILEGG